MDVMKIENGNEIRTGSGSKLAVTSPRTGSINLSNYGGSIPLTPPVLVPNPVLVPIEADEQECCICYDMVPVNKLTECKHAICNTCFPKLRSDECPTCTRVLKGGYLTEEIQQEWIKLKSLNAKIEKFLDDNENISLREFQNKDDMYALSRNTRDAYRSLLQDYPQLFDKPPYDRAIKGYREFSKFYHDQLNRNSIYDANQASEMFKDKMKNIVFK